MFFYARSEEAWEGVSAFATAAFTSPPQEKHALAYLRALRGGEEDFSFLSFFKKLCPPAPCIFAYKNADKIAADKKKAKVMRPLPFLFHFAFTAGAGCC